MSYELDKFNISDQQEILTLVMRDFTKSENWRSNKVIKWMEYLNYYHGKHLPEDIKNRANKNQIFIPYLFQVIQTIMPRIMGSQFAGDLIVTANPREKYDMELKTLIEQTIKFEFDNIPNLYLKAYNVFHNALLYGTGIAKVFWNKERQGLGFDYVHIGDIYPDPTATGIFDSRFIIHRVETTYPFLKKNEKRTDENGDIVGHYVNLEKVKDSSYPENYDTFQSIKEGMFENESYYGKNEKIELLEYWTPEWTITIANRQFVIRHIKNVYKELPFIIVYDYPEPNSFYGIGEGQLICPLNKEANLRRNQDLDNYDLQLQPIFALRTGSVKVRDVLTMYDKKVLPIASTEDIDKLIQRWSPQVQPGLGTQAEQQIKYDLQGITGIPDFTDPKGPAGSNDTATGKSIIAESTKQRINLKIDLINYMFAKELGRKILKYFYMFMPAEKVIRITNSSNIQPFFEFKLQKEDLKYWYTFDLIPATVKEQVDKRAHQERMTMLLQATQGLLNDPSVQAAQRKENFDINIRPILEEVYKAHELLNIEDILVVRQTTPLAAPGDSGMERIPEEGILDTGDNQSVGQAVSFPTSDIAPLEMGTQPPPITPVLHKQRLAQELLNG